MVGTYTDDGYAYDENTQNATLLLWHTNCIAMSRNNKPDFGFGWKTNLVACVEGNDGNVGNDDNEGNDGNDGNDGNNGNDDNDTNDGNNGNYIQKTNLIACVEGRAEVIFKVVVNLRMCGLADWSLI